MKISKVLRENPEDYKSKTCQSTKIGNALGKTKGELIEYFVSNSRKQVQVGLQILQILMLNGTSKVYGTQSKKSWRLQVIQLKTWQMNLVVTGSKTKSRKTKWSRRCRTSTRCDWVMPICILLQTKCRTKEVIHNEMSNKKSNGNKWR